MPDLRAWLRAARPLSLANVAVPVLFGAALAARAASPGAPVAALAWPGLGLALAWALADQLYIVFANELGDADADALAARLGLGPTAVSGGSRVLVEGAIRPVALRRAATLAALALIALSAYGAWRHGAWALPSCAALAIALLWAYSFPPIRASYRGGGEYLQALGVGLVLPAVGWQLQGRPLFELPPLALCGPCLAALASNLLTALPDTRADRAADKRTRPVRFGPGRARLEASALTFAAALAGVWLLPGRAGAVLAMLGAAGIALAFALAFARAHTRASRAEEPVGSRDADAPELSLRFVWPALSANSLLWVVWTLALLHG